MTKDVELVEQVLAASRPLWDRCIGRWAGRCGKPEISVLPGVASYLSKPPGACFDTWHHEIKLPELWRENVSQVGSGLGQAAGGFVLDCILAGRRSGGEPIFETDIVISVRGYEVKTKKRWVVRWATDGSRYLENNYANLKLAKTAKPKDDMLRRISRAESNEAIDMGFLSAVGIAMAEGEI